MLARGVELVAVSVDPAELSAALKKKLDFPIRFLCDGGKLMDLLDVRDAGGRPPGLVAGKVAKLREDRDIFLPTTFLLDENGIVRWVARTDSYRVRPRAEDVLAAIDRLGS